MPAKKKRVRNTRVWSKSLSLLIHDVSKKSKIRIEILICCFRLGWDKILEFF